MSIVRARPSFSKRQVLQNRSNFDSSLTGCAKSAGSIGKKKKRTSIKRPTSETVSVKTPPAGLQFVTTFDCKYYGSDITEIDGNGMFLQGQCADMVRAVMKRNSKQHLETLLQVTDKGVSITDKYDGNGMIQLATEDILRVMPGSLKTKSGKTFTIAIIIEAHETGHANNRPYHIFQFRHRSDAAHMHDASKRMWRDHMFSNLLDVSTEEGQEDLDISNMIERDIELANKRCSAIIEGDILFSTRRCSTLLSGGDL